MHQLLSAARIAPPYVLVDLSMGTFHARVVDPMHEDMTFGIHNHIEGFGPAVIFLFKTFGTVGGFRLVAPDPGPAPKSMTPREWSTV